MKGEESMNNRMQAVPVTVNAEDARNVGLGNLNSETIMNLQNAEEGTIAIIKALTGEDRARQEGKATCVLEQANYMRALSSDLAGALRKIYEMISE